MTRTAHDVLTAALANTASTTSLTLTLPTGWLENDICYAILNHRHGSTVSVTPPSGWTLIGSEQPTADRIGMFIYRRVLVSGDSNPSWTVDNHTSGWGLQGFVVRGADTSTPEAASATFSDVASATTASGSAVTPSSDGALLVSVPAVRRTDGVTLSTANGYRAETTLYFVTDVGNSGSLHVGLLKQESAASGAVPTWQAVASADWRIAQWAVASASYSADQPFVAGWSDPVVSSSSTTLNPALPANWAEDDVALVLAVNRNTSSPTFSISAGWTLVGSDNTSGRIAVSVWKRQLTASESAPTVTASVAGTGWGTFMLTLRNVTTTEDVTATAELGSAWTTNTPTSITTNTDRSVALLFLATGDDNNMTFDSDQGFEGLIGDRFDTLVGSDFGWVVGAKLVATAGSVTMPTVRQNNSPGDNSTAIKFALEAAALPAITGTIAATLADFTADFNGQFLRTGTIGTTLATIASSIAGVVSIQGTIDSTLADLTAEFVGKRTVQGTIAASIIPLASNAAAISGQVIEIDAKPWIYYVFYRTPDGDLALVESTNRLRRGGWSSGEGHELVSERFRTNLLTRRSVIDTAVAGAWAAESGSSAAALQTAIHAGLTAAGIKRYDGAALS